MGPVEAQLPLGGPGAEMAFPGEQQHELPGAQRIVPLAGLDVQGAPGDGDELIGLDGALGMEELVLIVEIARGQETDRPGGV